MKLIQLTRELSTKVSDIRFAELSKHKWYAKKTGDNGSFYAARFQRINGKPTTFYMHREIVNCPDGFEVDHDNGDTLDNQDHNLKIVTKKVNLANRFKRKK